MENGWQALWNSLSLAQVSGEMCAIQSRMWNDFEQQLKTSATILAFHCVVAHRWIAKNIHISYIDE